MNFLTPVAPLKIARQSPHPSSNTPKCSRHGSPQEQEHQSGKCPISSLLAGSAMLGLTASTKRSHKKANSKQPSYQESSSSQHATRRIVKQSHLVHERLGSLFDALKLGATGFLESRNIKDNPTDVVNAGLGGQDVLIIDRKEDVQAILTQQSKSFDKGRFAEIAKEIHFGQSMLFVDTTDYWKALRHAVNPFFKPTHLDAHLHEIMEIADQVNQEVIDKELEHKIDFYELSKKFTMAIMLKTMFGQDQNKVDLDAIVKEYEVLNAFVASESTKYPFRTPDWFPGQNEINETRSSLYSRFDDFIAHKDDHLERVIHKLEGMQTDPQFNLSRRQIHDQMNTLLFAGHDSTSFTLSYLIYELQRSPDLYEKIKHEIDTHLRDTDGKIQLSYEKLQRNAMPFLDAAVHEVLRLHPGVSVIYREANEDVTLNGLEIKKGQLIALQLKATHRNPESFDKPEEFIPERFLENPKLYQNLVAFGLGERGCLGQHLSVLESKLYLISMISKDLKPKTIFPEETIERGVIASELTNGMPMIMQKV